MTVKKAAAHEALSSEEQAHSFQGDSSAGKKPTPSSHKVAEQGHGHRVGSSPTIVGAWREGPEATEWGEETESMHEFKDRKHRGEGSMHEERTAFKCDDDDNNDNDDDDDDTTFIGDFLRDHNVKASRRETMRSFYEVRCHTCALQDSNG